MEDLKGTMETDLKRGHKGEAIAIRYLEERLSAHQVFQVDGYFPPYDLFAVFQNGKELRVEVKIDYKCATTGNIAIEYRHNSGFSGVIRSKADMYIIIAKGKLLAMDKEYLLAFLGCEDFREVDGGDGDKSTFILVPFDRLVSEEFVTVWDYTKKVTAETSPVYLHEL